jgi:hypothetical protein
MQTFSYLNPLNPAKNCKITQLSATSYQIEIGEKTLVFNEEGKPVFQGNTGELVIEFSGLALVNPHNF